jgi:hypothetical protein
VTNRLPRCQHNFLAIINGNTRAKNLIGRDKIGVGDITGFPCPLAMSWLIEGNGIRSKGLWVSFEILSIPAEDVYALVDGNYHRFNASRHRSTINRDVPPLPVVNIHSDEGRYGLIFFNAKSSEYENKGGVMNPNKCEARLA